MSPTITLSSENAVAVHWYAELAGVTPEQFLYVSTGFDALKKAANVLPDLT